MIFYNNDFEENVGLFGGAININSPNWSEIPVTETSPTTSTVASATKPYLIFKLNRFNKNMAYISGNALHIRHARREEKPLESCGIAYFEENKFKENFGFKITDGGGITMLCSSLNDKLHRDYVTPSSIPADTTLGDTAVSDGGIVDMINPTMTYSPYFRSTIFW